MTGHLAQQSGSKGMNRRLFVAGASALALAAPSIGQAQGQSLKIGIMLPRSGFFAQAGQSCHREALAAPKVLADLGYKVELVHIDIDILSRCGEDAGGAGDQ